MGIFDLFIKASGAGSDPQVAKNRLVSFVIESLWDKNKRIRAEDGIALASTIVAERCIDLAGDYPLRDHQLTPGQRVLSTKINGILFADQADLELHAMLSDSVLGMLRDQLTPAVYQEADFPDLQRVVKDFAAKIGKAEDWGKVPLSVPQDNLPKLIPLQAGFMSRPKVDQILGALAAPKERLRVSVLALADILQKVRPILDPKLALLLTVEMLNGMAKTAPMTEKAMKAAMEKKEGKP